MSPTEIVLKQFPNRVSLSVAEAGAALGYARQTTYNLKAKGKFPVRISFAGKTPIVHLHDLISFLEGFPASNDSNFTPAPKKKGRPSKADALRKAGVI